jgi:hypothetical protein
MPTCAASSARRRRDAVRDLDGLSIRRRRGSASRRRRPIRIVCRRLDIVLDYEIGVLWDLCVPSACFTSRSRRCRAAPSHTITRCPIDALADRRVGVDDAVVAHARRGHDDAGG